MHPFDELNDGRELPAGEPTRDPALRAMLGQMLSEGPGADAALVARLRERTRPALAARSTVVPIALAPSRRRRTVTAFRVAFAAATAAAVFAVLQPVPGYQDPNDVLLAATVGAVTQDTQQLWSSALPLQLPLTSPSPASSR